MIEFIRHALGLCGEGHVSLLTLLCGGGIFCITAILPFLKTRFMHKKGCTHHKDDTN